MINLKSPADIKLLRTSGSILAGTLSALQKQAKEGVSLLDLEKFARKLIESKGGSPAFLGYRPTSKSIPYPASICASLNETIVHGIPYDMPLKKGDLLTLDTGVSYKGLITDGALTIGIGEISKPAKRLLKAAREALEAGIKECRSGKRIGDIGYAIESAVKKYGFSVVNKLTGHGVGFSLHEPPIVYNYGEKHTGALLEEGMVLAIEPMVSLGRPEVIEKKDGSFETKDKSPAAHFEKTIAITKKGPLILTPIRT